MGESWWGIERLSELRLARSLQESHPLEQRAKSRFGTEGIEQWIGLDENHVTGAILVGFVEPFKRAVPFA